MTDALTRVLVVDDEPLARQRIARLLGGAVADVALREASNGLEALQLIRSDPPDVLFLDVQMPGLTGFEVLQHLEGSRPKIIFVTAHDRFAVRAFDENACDYLLKPCTQERLHQAFVRARQAIDQDDRLHRLEAELARSAHYLTRLTVQVGQTLKLIEQSEIYCFVSQEHYTFVHTATNEYICTLSLQRLSEQLDPRRFRRLHRNTIVQLDKVASVQLGPPTSVLLRNGMKLLVSRANRPVLKELGLRA